MGLVIVVSGLNVRGVEFKNPNDSDGVGVIEDSGGDRDEGGPEADGVLSLEVMERGVVEGVVEGVVVVVVVVGGGFEVGDSVEGDSLVVVLGGPVGGEEGSLSA